MNVLPPNFCLVLMDFSVVLMDGWSLFICVCKTSVKVKPTFLEGTAYACSISAKSSFLAILTLFCEYMLHLACGIRWFRFLGH